MMTEKAARIAELESEIEWRESRSPVGTKHQQRNAFALAEARTELAHLRNEIALTQGEGSEPVGWSEPLLTLDYVGGMIDEFRMFGATAEDLRKLRVRINKTLENAPASPPPLPAGNADPRVREALEKIKALYDDVTTVVRDFKTPEPWFNYRVERSKGYLYGLSGNGLIASGTIGTYKEFELICEVLNNLPILLANALPSPQSQGLVEAAEWHEAEATKLKAKAPAPFCDRLSETEEFERQAIKLHLEAATHFRTRASDRSA